MDYKEKLRLAKEALDSGSYDKETIEYIFPELKESGNIRIIKAIKYGLDHVFTNNTTVFEVTKEQCLAWLEKQGELKPADKTEPKFKIGDWVVAISSGNLFKILSVHNGLYKVLCEDGIETNYPFKEVDKDLRLWTIQDAKEGDVLEFGDHGRLVTGILSFVNKTTGKVDVSCLLEGDKFKVGVFYNLDTVKPHPATKEQRDILFKKMKEAGYEWDADKKELKKIEQKPAWSEEDDEMLDSIIEEVRYTGDFPDYPTKEEDELYDECLAKVEWLKSLKDRVQPKQEWSEEDAKALNRISVILVDASEVKNWWKEYRLIERDEMIRLTDFLKSLKPQTTWKPSDEQMKALEHFVRSIGESGYASPYDNNTKLLYSLLSDLKKLKE